MGAAKETQGDPGSRDAGCARTGPSLAAQSAGKRRHFRGTRWCATWNGGYASGGEGVESRVEGGSPFDGRRGRSRLAVRLGDARSTARPSLRLARTWQAIQDKLLGTVLLSLSLLIFVYYTLWVVVTPFVDASHFVQAFFPDRKYGVMLPAVLLVLLIVVAGTFVGAVMYSTKKANKTK